MGGQMRTYRVSTPTPGYTGEVGGVMFVRGLAVVDAPAPLPKLGYDEKLTGEQADEREAIGQHPGYRAMAYFRQAGYVVEDITVEDLDVDDEDPGDDELEAPHKNASTDDWRAYAKASGMPAEQADAMSRDQLVEHYTKGAGA